MTPPLSTRTSRHIKHLGSRPKDDYDNHCREKLCHLVKDVGCFYEICPEKLYMVYLAKGESLDEFLDSAHDESPFIFWSHRDKPQLVYEAFNMDFGPFNLGVTHQFCSKLKVWLDTQPFRSPDKIIVVVLDDTDTEAKLNTTLLVAIAGMVLLNLTDEEVLQRLSFFMMYKGKPGEASKQLVFREKKKFADVSGNHSALTLTLVDCVKAFYAALQYKFYQYYEFDHTEYLFYETVMSGDLNWIIPGKILAFAGPSDSSSWNRHRPRFYYRYFNDHQVTDIIRLNDPEYESEGFTKHGFKHHDLIFPDGYPPTSTIAAKFIKIVDEASGAVAVHCYAGIGRTGTLIAAYLMARYNFTPHMAIAWTRMCRPGSVIGDQQDWLLNRFDQYAASISPGKPQASSKGDGRNRKIKTVDNTTLVESASPPATPTKAELAADAAAAAAATTTYAVAEKTLGQAKALVLAKKQRENSDKRPRTRSNLASLKRASLDGDTCPSKGAAPAATKMTDINLGNTVPLSLYLADVLPLNGLHNPDHYRLKDGKYCWKVRWPKSGYVELKHAFDEDLQAIEDEELNVTDVIETPLLDFRFQMGPPLTSSSSSSSSTLEDKQQAAAVMRPTIYYQLCYARREI